MEKPALKKHIEVASGKLPADTVIQNCKIIDVYNAEIIEGDIAICDGFIAGVGRYKGIHEIDAGGLYAAPGLIDSHVHIESSFVSPEEFGRLVVPCGTTTVIADPHEIANVCGLKGLNYMIEAAKETALDFQWMLPSCVPATPFEHAGAVIDAQVMAEPLARREILGLGEFMDFPGVIGAREDILEKILAAKQQGKVIDGHSPGIRGKALNAYTAARIRTDHECSTVEEMHDRISRGMYVLMRQGSACRNLRELLKGVTLQNSRRCLLCTDDCQPRTIMSDGHIDNHLRICVEEGLDPMTAIQMASLNAAECYGLGDRGAIVPGLRADIVLFDNLKEFNAQSVWVGGREAASAGKYTLPVFHHDSAETKGSFHVKDFSEDKLRLILGSDWAHLIRIMPGGVVTARETAEIKRDSKGNFVFDPSSDIVKIAVVERHQNTGNVAVALLKGYGIRKGAVALSIAHDSHNIIAVGVHDEDMAFAVQALIRQGGGIILAEGQQVLESMPLPIAGLMSDQSGAWVDEKLTQIHEAAHEILGVSRDVEPVMTLCFMALPVIPEIKLTDMGLFDVTKFDFITVEA